MQQYVDGSMMKDNKIIDLHWLELEAGWQVRAQIVIPGL